MTGPRSLRTPKVGDRVRIARGVLALGRPPWWRQIRDRIEGTESVGGTVERVKVAGHWYPSQMWEADDER